MVLEWELRTPGVSVKLNLKEMFLIFGIIVYVTKRIDTNNEYICALEFEKSEVLITSLR